MEHNKAKSSKMKHSKGNKYKFRQVHRRVGSHRDTGKSRYIRTNFLDALAKLEQEHEESFEATQGEQ